LPTEGGFPDSNPKVLRCDFGHFLSLYGQDKLFMGGAAERLKCEREYNAQMMAAETKRKAAAESGSDGVPPAQSAG
jgi:hypothetical protein